MGAKNAPPPYISNSATKRLGKQAPMTPSMGHPKLACLMASAAAFW